MARALGGQVGSLEPHAPRGRHPESPCPSPVFCRCRKDRHVSTFLLCLLSHELEANTALQKIIHPLLLPKLIPSRNY